MLIRNPVISGFNPDPSCICVDGTFYLVTSTFLYFPGIAVYASTDLMHWKHIGNVVSRSSQIDYTTCRIREGTQLAGGLWAPTIRYHDGQFYVTTTLVFPDRMYDDFSRWKNMIFTCTNPYSNDWSDPIFFNYPGYDTSLFWDDDGKAYVQGSFYWRVREEISQFQIDLTNGRTLSGEPQKIWSGTGGRAPEAPHMYKKDGWYYLLIAEGGTELGHCATIARGKSVWGPFTPCPHSPVLSASSSTAMFQTIGHADLFCHHETGKEKQWWAVCLATRIVNESFPMGRETCLVDVDWTEDWPIIKGGVREVVTTGIDDTDELDIPRSSWQNVLSKPYLDLLYLRNPSEAAYSFSVSGELTLRSSPDVPAIPLSSPLGTPIFVGYRQKHVRFESDVIFDISCLSSDVEVGLAVYLDHEHYFAASLNSANNKPTHHWLCKTFGSRNIQDTSRSAVAVAGDGQAVSIRLSGECDKYTFEVGQAREESTFSVLGSCLSKDLSGGFTGVIIAVFLVPVHNRLKTQTRSDVKVEGWRHRSLDDL